MAKEELVKVYEKKLMDNAEMLNDFLSIEISTGLHEGPADEATGLHEGPVEEMDSSKPEDVGRLVALPIVVLGVKPFVEELPMFILRLASEVDYSNESSFIKNASHELAFYYARYIDFLTY